METTIDTITTDFSTKIQQNITSIDTTIKTIKEKIQILRNIYIELTELNGHKQIFLFCLETFNFQNKMMINETDHLHKSFNMLLNRTYRDYYKLYGIILKLYEDYKLENPTTQKHPEYKDLDINTEFTLEQITNIHSDVICLTSTLILKYREGERVISGYRTKSRTGIHIINLINTIEYDNSILKDQIQLYINYLTFFQETQYNYFSKLDQKMKAFLEEIKKDINFQENGLDPEEEIDVVPENVAEENDDTASLVGIESSAIAENIEFTITENKNKRPRKLGMNIF